MKQKQLLLLLALLMTAATGAWAQTGMTKGSFSVSATKRVYFSKGNLQYDGTNWKFAASQWEVLGANGTGANGTATDYPMDLFTWGNIDSPTSNGTTYYTENADLSGITDWGSRMGSGWYTLSKDEWLYLFGMESNNTDKSGHARYRKYFRATVNGVKGIVVLPDDLSGISDIPAESSRGTASNFNGKTYTTDAWSAMESAGCVFLPTAGFRNGASVSYVGSSGFYWPSTAYDAGKAYTMGFDSDNVFPANNFNRNLGFSVRLVIDQYYLTLADGTKDAAKWTATVGTSNTANPLPVGGLNEKDAVTLQYTGRLKVKGVKATSDEKPASPPSWKLTLSSPAKDLCIIANGGVIAQQTLDVASTEFTVEMPELTSQTVNIFATDGSGNCWYCTQENMSFAIGQTYQSSPTMTAIDEDNNKPLYKITATSDVTIPDGKTVVLSGVNISGGSITCDGSVTMILMGANTVTGASENAAIKIGGPGTTLTITGSGSLTAQGGVEAAGIGTDRIEDDELSFGNIVINGGTVTATGGKEGAGIGTGLADGEFYTTSITCGDITINGGTVTATGGGFGPGIGTGVFLKYGGESASNRCGAITIGAGVTSVTATKGSSDSPNSIGKGYAQGGTQTYGTITIGGTVYATGVTASPFTYTPSN